MAAKLRHPNLVQFLGAATEGEMTELMSTSLRSQLQKDDSLVKLSASMWPELSHIFIESSVVLVMI